jgi:hypothetical protein
VAARSAWLLACPALLLALTAFAAEPAGTSCTSSCEIYKAKLEKLNCREAFAETSAYLSRNRAIVANFPDELRNNRSAVDTFAAAVEVAARAALDCLVKEHKSRTTMDAYLRIDEFRSFLLNWVNDRPPIPRNLEPDYLTRLLTSHARTIDALSRASAGQ